jgi:hypothetical protein
MYKIMYNEIGRCGVAHRLGCYEDYCTCMLASSVLLSAVSLARAQFSGKRAQALFAGMATHSVLSSEAPASAAVSLTLMAAGHASGWRILRGSILLNCGAMVRRSARGPFKVFQANVDRALTLVLQSVSPDVVGCSTMQ